MPHLSQLLAHSRDAEQQAPQRAHRLPLLPELLLRLILCQQQGTVGRQQGCIGFSAWDCHNPKQCLASVNPPKDPAGDCSGKCWQPAARHGEASSFILPCTAMACMQLHIHMPNSHISPITFLANAPESELLLELLSRLLRLDSFRRLCLPLLS